MCFLEKYVATGLCLVLVHLHFLQGKSYLKFVQMFRYLVSYIATVSSVNVEGCVVSKLCNFALSSFWYIRHKMLNSVDRSTDF